MPCTRKTIWNRKKIDWVSMEWGVGKTCFKEFLAKPINKNVRLLNLVQMFHILYNIIFIQIQQENSIKKFILNIFILNIFLNKYDTFEVVL